MLHDSPIVINVRFAAYAQCWADSADTRVTIVALLVSSRQGPGPRGIGESRSHRRAAPPHRRFHGCVGSSPAVLDALAASG
jgi:hypothetical protein